VGVCRSITGWSVLDNFIGCITFVEFATGEEFIGALQDGSFIA